MNFILIVHLLAALFTVVFAVYTGFNLFHRYSLNHRFEKIKSRMMPLIIGRISKARIIELLKKEAYEEQELIEIYDYLASKQTPNKN